MNITTRMKRSKSLIRLTRTGNLTVADLIYPIFIREDQKNFEIPSMKGQNYLSLKNAVKKCEEVYDLGIPGVMIFNVLAKRDKYGKIALKKGNFEGKVFEKIKDEFGDGLTLISNICLCAYTKDEYCAYSTNGKILNQKTAEMLGKISVLHADSGADIIAPASMVDGQVKAIRTSLDMNGHDDIPIMTYIKSNSSLFSPFYKALSGGGSGRKNVDPSKTRVDIMNEKMFLQKLELDISEGADIVIIKPALPNLDILRLTREKYPEVFLASYQVSGEYVMIKTSSEDGYIDEKKVILETLQSIKRAGADMILTYFAVDIAKNL